MNTSNLSSSHDFGQLDGTTAYLRCPFGREHLFSRKIESTLLYEVEGIDELLHAIETHVKDHIYQDGLPDRIEVKKDGDFYSVLTSRCKIVPEKHIALVACDAVIREIAAHTYRDFSNGVHVWFKPSTLGSGKPSNEYLVLSIT